MGRVGLSPQGRLFDLGRVVGRSERERFGSGEVYCERVVGERASELPSSASRSATSLPLCVIAPLRLMLLGTGLGLEA
jgi:hypothetical protein